MKKFRETIQEICQDTKHGSSVLVQEVIEALRHFDPSETQQQWALQQLTAIDPAMVVVHHLLRGLAESHGPLQERLQRYIAKWDKVEKLISERLAPLLPTSPMTVLLHSHSGSVIRVLSHLVKEGYDLTIVQTVSRPGEEGRVQCEELRKMGFEVHLIEDGQLGRWVGKIDVCLLGVDQYDDRSFVNKVGSGQIVDVLGAEHAPIFIIGDTRKRVSKIRKTIRVPFEAVSFRSDVTLVTEEG